MRTPTKEGDKGTRDKGANKSGIDNSCAKSAKYKIKKLPLRRKRKTQPRL